MHETTGLVKAELRAESAGWKVNEAVLDRRAISTGSIERGLPFDASETGCMRSTTSRKMAFFRGGLFNLRRMCFAGAEFSELSKDTYYALR